MFKPVRVVATIVFLLSIGLVFVGAFVLRNEVGWFWRSFDQHKLKQRSFPPIFKGPVHQYVPRTFVSVMLLKPTPHQYL